MFITTITMNEKEYREQKLYDNKNIHTFVYKNYAKYTKDNRVVYNADIKNNNFILQFVHDKEITDCNFNSETTKLLDGFFNKRKYYFSIKINSVMQNKKNRLCTNNPKNHRVPSIKFAEWFSDKFEKNGLKLIDLIKIKNYTQNSDNKRNISHYVSECTGFLEVQDIEKFKKAVQCGVGRGKAFGLGMLLVKPIN